MGVRAEGQLAGQHVVLDRDAMHHARQRIVEVLELVGLGDLADLALAQRLRRIDHRLEVLEHHMKALAVPDVGQAALHAGGFRRRVDAVELLMRDHAIELAVDVLARSHGLGKPAARAITFSTMVILMG